MTDDSARTDVLTASDGANTSALLMGNFTAGELSPALYARTDLSKWHAGLKTCRNFFVNVQGGASNRAGTRFVGFAKLGDNPVRLLPFAFSTTQTYILEFGAGYIRFIANGGYVVNAGVPVEVATPYAAGDLFLVKFCQSADTLTLTHPSYPPAQLKRTSAVSFTYTAITFGTSLATVTGVHGAANGTQPGGSPPPPLLPPVAYAVTQVQLNPPDESLLSASTQITNYGLGFFQSTNVYNAVFWTSTGADHYNVYKLYFGQWSFCAATTGDVNAGGAIPSGSTCQWQDQNVLPDTNTSPPQHQNPFAGSNYPGCCCYFQQRQVFGGSTANPQAIWMTRTGNFTSMDTSLPTRDDDAITLTIASNQVNQIKHFVAVNDLVVFTSGGAWKLSGQSNQGDVVTPANVVCVPQSYAGASDVPPIVIAPNILYVQQKGGSVRDLSYNVYTNLYTGTDVSVLSAHLFQGYVINDWAWAMEPWKVIWAVRNDGNLVGLTYLREQEVYAWHRHDTGATVDGSGNLYPGQFQSVAVISEGNEDVPYFVVRRFLNGAWTRTIERMQSRVVPPGDTAGIFTWFLDCALAYNGGTAITTVTGLNHLAGQTVSILADGSVKPQQVVSSGGTITLDHPAFNIVAGLPIQAQLETLPIDAGQPTIQAKRKRITRATLHVYNTRGLKVGPQTEKGPLLSEIPSRHSETYGQPPSLFTGQQKIDVVGDWNFEGSLWVQQDYPLAATVLGIEPWVGMGE